MSAKRTDRDLVAEAIANAPLGPPPSEEEKRAVAEARARLAAGGRWLSTEEVLAAIEAKRRRDEGR